MMSEMDHRILEITEGIILDLELLVHLDPRNTCSRSSHAHAINGVSSFFLGADFISVNKEKDINWEDIKHIVITLINEHYQSGKKFVIDKDPGEDETKETLIDIEKQIIKVLDTKVDLL